MNLFTQTANGHNGNVTDDLTPGQTLNLDFASAYAVGPLTTPRPRASLAALDAFRTLALTIESLDGDSPSRSIALLSAAPGEGRSLSAELLSLAFSEIRPPVRLIDADPFQHTLKKRNHRRLSLMRKVARQEDEMWEEQLPLESSPAIGEVSAFDRIPLARDSYPGRLEFLQDVESALDAAVGMGAQVFVDAPACSMSSIGFSIAQMVDAAIYVVRPDRATLQSHQEVLAQLTLLKINVLGIVLNEG
jgi:Mrp family chromosome partitioning ATPase